jgi:hypothetical protein
MVVKQHFFLAKQPGGIAFRHNRDRRCLAILSRYTSPAVIFISAGKALQKQGKICLFYPVPAGAFLREVHPSAE